MVTVLDVPEPEKCLPQPGKGEPVDAPVRTAADTVGVACFTTPLTVEAAFAPAPVLQRDYLIQR